MKRKVLQLQQIERLRRRLHEMSAWQLTRVQWERERLTSAHAETLEALGTGPMAYGPLAQSGNRRLRSLEREMAIAGGKEKELARQTLDDGRLAKLAEQVLATARDEWLERLERRSLEELIEATLPPGSASRKP